MTQTFSLYPAIDLRFGQVVCLKQGDAAQQTIYDDNPASRARLWMESGAAWLHVVNLDGAFDADQSTNEKAIQAICAVAKAYPTKIQLGGGIRSLAAIEKALCLGVTRVIMGTAAVENPQLLEEALSIYGKDALALGLDARDGYLQTHGWVTQTKIRAIDLACEWVAKWLKWVIFTDIARDGVGTGINLSATQTLVQASACSVIAPLVCVVKRMYCKRVISAVRVSLLDAPCMMGCSHSKGFSRC